MLELDIIEERPTAWGSPCCVVAKKNSSPRFCEDCRHTFNKHFILKSLPLLNMDFCLGAVCGAKYITVADIMSAFWQLPVVTEEVDETAFVTPSMCFCVYLWVLRPRRGCFNV